MNKLIPSRFTKFFDTQIADSRNETPSDLVSESYAFTEIPSNKNEISLQIETSEHAFGARRYFNCINKLQINDILESIDINEDLEDHKNILLLKFQFSEYFGELNQNDIYEINKKCNNKAVIIYLESKNYEQIHIYWKTKTEAQFYNLKQIKHLKPVDNKKLHEYIIDFLLQSLINGHSGLIESIADQKQDLAEVEINSIADLRKFNLLMQACEKGRADIVRITLSLGMNTHLQGRHVSAQSLAMLGHHYDVIYELIEANLEFPKKFDIRKCPEYFQEVYKITEELHESIKDKNAVKIKNILNQNKNKCYFYNTLNESALKVAIKCQSMEAYEVLLDRKIRFGPHENAEDILTNLSYSNKRIAREIHDKQKHNSPENHINILMASSFICHDDLDPDEKWKLVNRAYRTLSSNTFIQIILMIVAATKKFKIIFDFSRNSVSVADPTVDSNTQGLFYKSGRIYIGAKQLLNESNQNETLATMAHEFCHYAMNLVYRNDARPYTKNDHQTMQEFEKISEKCRKKTNIEFFIDIVYECYTVDMHHAELIVRVVHLMAFYHELPEKLKAVKEHFSELFEFYTNKVYLDLKKALPEIEASETKKMQQKDRKIFWYKLLLLVIGFLAAIIIYYLIPRTYKFSELSPSDKKTVRNAPVIYKNVDLKFLDLFPENSSVYDNLTSDQISMMLDNSPLNFNDLSLSDFDQQIKHDWDKMAQKLKEKVLNSNFTFQKETTKLENLYAVYPNVFKSLTSNQIINILSDQELNVGKMVKNEEKFYMERRFHDENIYPIYFAYMLNVTSNSVSKILTSNIESDLKFEDFYEHFNEQRFEDYSKEIKKIKYNWMYNKIEFKISNNSTLDTNALYKLNFNEIFQKAENSKMFILSSEAGTGKTRTFENFTMRIKNKNPMRWVSFIDLKDFIRFYNKTKTVINVENLLEKILGLNSNNEFELNLFYELFKSGNAIFLWNGFDEIYPDYSDFILDVLMTIKQNTENIQFICTRPLHSEKLKEKLHVTSYKLVPFDRKDQDEFLKNVFYFQSVDEINYSNYTQKVYKIINSSESIQNFNTPLMLVMIAELIACDSNIYENENLFQIYDKFINRKIEIWQKRSDGEKVGRFLKNNKELSIREVLQRYALYDTFENENLSGFKIMRQKVPEVLTNVEISRLGILYINGDDNIQFAHRTFREFLIAQYFIENIYNVDDVSVEEAELRVKLFLIFFVGEYHSNAVTIKFTNYYLKTDSAVKAYNFHKNIIKNFRIEFKNNIAYKFLNSGNYKMYEFLVGFLKRDKTLLFDLLHLNDNETLYTAAYNYYHFHLGLIPYKYLHALKELAEKILDTKELEHFIHGRNQRGISEVSQFMNYKKYNLNFTDQENKLDDEILRKSDFKTLLKHLENELTEDEIHELITSNTSPFHDKDFSDIQDSEKEIERISSKDEFKVFINNSFKEWTYYKRKDQFVFLMSKAEELMTDTEIYEMFSKSNILYLTLRYEQFESFWTCFANHTNEEQQKEILLRIGTDVPQSNILINNFIYNRSDQPQFDFIKRVYEKLFGKNELNKMLSDSCVKKYIYDAKCNELTDLLNNSTNQYESN